MKQLHYETVHECDMLNGIYVCACADTLGLSIKCDIVVLLNGTWQYGYILVRLATADVLDIMAVSMLARKELQQTSLSEVHTDQFLVRQRLCSVNVRRPIFFIWYSCVALHTILCKSDTIFQCSFSVICYRLYVTSRPFGFTAFSEETDMFVWYRKSVKTRLTSIQCCHWVDVEFRTEISYKLLNIWRFCLGIY